MIHTSIYDLSMPFYSYYCMNSIQPRPRRILMGQKDMPLSIGRFDSSKWFWRSSSNNSIVSSQQHIEHKQNDGYFVDAVAVRSERIVYLAEKQILRSIAAHPVGMAVRTTKQRLNDAHKWHSSCLSPKIMLTCIWCILYDVKEQQMKHTKWSIARSTHTKLNGIVAYS